MGILSRSESRGAKDRGKHPHQLHNKTNGRKANRQLTDLLPAGEARLGRDLVREAEVGERDPFEVAQTIVDEKDVFRLDVAMQDAWTKNTGF